MAKGKHAKTQKQISDQKKRTAQNQVRKYRRLLQQSPNDFHAPTWKKILDYYEQQL